MLDITPSGQACGAIVRGLDLRSIDTDSDPETGTGAGTVAAIRAAWLDHKVLSFPDQQLTDDDLVAFIAHFGPFGDDPYFEPVDGNPHVAAIERRADETSSLFAENWHADWSFQEFPPDGTCLYGKVIPPVGGDTLFADQQLALAEMPDELRSRIEGKLAVHSARGGYAPDGTYGDDDADRSMRIRPDETAYATQLHPFIRVHPETGRETLYSTIGYIIGIEDTPFEEAWPLLREVAAWQVRDEFVYRHEWEPNMLTMWDNRCVLHRATGGYQGHDRLLHRATIGYNPEMGQPVLSQ